METATFTPKWVIQMILLALLIIHLTLQLLIHFPGPVGLLLACCCPVVLTSAFLALHFIRFWYQSRQVYGHFKRPENTSILHLWKRFIPDGDFYPLVRAMRDRDTGEIAKIMYHGMYMDGSHAISLSSVEAVQQVLMDIKTFPKGKAFYDAYSILLGKGTVNVTGDQWKKQRRILQPLFHSAKLNTYLPTMIDSARYFLNQLKQRSADGTQSIFFQDNREFKQVILRSVLFVGYGNMCQIDILEKNYLDLWNAMKLWVPLHLAFGAATQYLPIPWRLLGCKSLFDSLGSMDRITRTYIAKRRQELVDNPQAPMSDLIALLVKSQEGVLEDGLEPITDDVIIDEVNAFLLAGHDTTANTLSFCAQLIAKHPSVQERLHEEIDRVYDEHSLDDISQVDQLLQLFPFVLATFKETLRLYPPSPVYDRQSARSVKVGDEIIPQGSTVLLWAINVQRDKTIWKEPECFVPDRFMPLKSRNADPNFAGEAETVLSKSKFAFIPFLEGSRKCMGIKFAYQEAVLILSLVLRHFRISLVQEGYAAFEATVKPTEMFLELIPRRKME